MTNKISLSGVTSILDAANELNVYILHFKTNLVGTNFKCFKSTDQATAYKRGQEHCKTMGYRFMNVAPLFSDLEADEVRKVATGGDALAGKLTKAS